VAQAGRTREAPQPQGREASGETSEQGRQQAQRDGEADAVRLVVVVVSSVHHAQQEVEIGNEGGAHDPGSTAAVADLSGVSGRDDMDAQAGQAVRDR
jgi:hypothetical protein